MKKFISILMVLILAVCLCSCREIEKSEEVVNAFFTALTSDNKDGVKQCIAHEEETAENNDNENTADENKDENEVKSLNDYGQDYWNAFSKITYEIKSAEKDKEDKKKVNVVVDVSAVDLATLYKNAVTEALQNIFANIFSVDENVDISDEAFDRFAKSLSEENLPMAANTVNISVIKTKEGWKIEPDDELYNAITGGFISYVKQLGENEIGGY